MKVCCKPKPSVERHAEAGCELTQRLYDKYGEMLLKAKHPVLKEYLLERKRAVKEIEAALIHQDKERARARLSQVREELLEIGQALEMISSH